MDPEEFKAQRKVIKSRKTRKDKGSERGPASKFKADGTPDRRFKDVKKTLSSPLPATPKSRGKKKSARPKGAQKGNNLACGRGKNQKLAKELGMKQVVGSKRQVYNGTALMTSGRLDKSDLMKNNKGKVVSKDKHALGMRLVREGKLTPVTKGQSRRIRDIESQ